MLLSSLLFLLNGTVCLATTVVWQEYPRIMYRNFGLHAGDSYTLTLLIKGESFFNGNLSTYEMVLYDSNITLNQNASVLDDEQNLFRIDFELPRSVTPGIHQFGLRSHDGEFLDELSRRIRIMPPLPVPSPGSVFRLFSLPDDITQHFGGMSERIALSKVSKSFYDPFKCNRGLLRNTGARKAIASACGSKFYTEMLTKVSIDSLDYSNPMCFKSLFSNYEYLDNFKWTELKLSYWVIRQLTDPVINGDKDKMSFLISFLERFISIVSLPELYAKIDVLSKALTKVLASPDCRLTKLEIAAPVEILHEILMQNGSFKLVSLTLQIRSDNLRAGLNAQTLHDMLQNLFQNGSLRSFGLDINVGHQEGMHFWESFRGKSSFQRITKLCLRNPVLVDSFFSGLVNLKELELDSSYFISNSLIELIDISTTLKNLNLSIYRNFESLFQSLNRSTSIHDIIILCKVPYDQVEIVDFNLLSGKNADISVDIAQQNFEKLRGIEHINQMTLKLHQYYLTDVFVDEESALGIFRQIKDLTGLKSLIIECEATVSTELLQILFMEATQVEHLSLSFGLRLHTSVPSTPFKSTLLEYFKKAKARKVDFSNSISFYFGLIEIEWFFENGAFSRECSIKSFAFTITCGERESDFKRFFEVLATQRTSLSEITLHVSSDQFEIIRKGDSLKSAFVNYVGPISVIEIVEGGNRVFFQF